MSNKKYLIYKYTSPSDKSYIGQTIDLKRRTQQHTRLSSKCPYFSNAIQKYGIDNFTLEILAENLSLEETNILEEKFIEEHNTLFPNGYNLKPGGKNRTQHETTKQKISNLKTGVKRKPRSEEYCKNISLAHIGVKRGPISDKHKQILIETNIGRKHSEEAILKMKKSKQNMSEETKQKMRKPKLKSNKRSLTNTGRKLQTDPITGLRKYYYPKKD